jgi:hypothetical protein
MFEILYALSLIGAFFVGLFFIVMAGFVIALWVHELRVRKDNIDYERTRYRLRSTLRLPARYPRPTPLLVRLIEIAIVAIGIAFFIWYGNSVHWDFPYSHESNSPYFDSPDPE